MIFKSKGVLYFELKEYKPPLKITGKYWWIYCNKVHTNRYENGFFNVVSDRK
jgi:hypothetical protein